MDTILTKNYIYKPDKSLVLLHTAVLLLLLLLLLYFHENLELKNSFIIHSTSSSRERGHVGGGV